MDTQTLVLLSFMREHPWIVLSIIIWSLAWKLTALWKAAKHNHITIFVVIGVLNTVGILEIIYIIWLYIKERKNKMM
jgi:methionyl-tRNA synthetase